MAHTLLDAATELATRRLSGQTGPTLSYPMTEFRHAFALQTAMTTQYCQLAKTQVSGWKCLLPTGDKQVVAPIFADTSYTLAQANSAAHIQDKMPSEPCPISPSSKQLARIEPELAFVFGSPLPSRQTPYSQAEIDAAIGSCHMALELIKSRYQTPSEVSYFDALADGLVNQGLVLGPEIDLAIASKLSQFPLTVSYSDAAEQAPKAIVKDAVHPNVEPKAGLYWLVNFLSGQGIDLHPGQAIITGSYAGVLDLPLDTDIEFIYGDVGRFCCRFIAR